MQTQRGTRLAVAALLVVAVLLALIDLHLISTPIQTAPIAPPRSGAGASPPRLPQPATPLDGRTADAFFETVSRPLFHPDRRPIENGGDTAARPKEAPLMLRLVGVVKEGAGPPRALIRLGGNPRGTWVAEGADVDGWTLAKVNEHSVILKTGGRSRKIKLFIPRPLGKKTGQSPPVSKAGPAPAGPPR